MTFEEWWKGYTGSDKDKSLVMGKVYAQSAWDYQQARIEALESQNKQLLERRDTEYLRMLEWRGIDGIENACERCGGSGTAVYGSTSTWRGGAGGQMITSDICDRCWGSGDKSNKWTNLRRLPRLQPPEQEGE